MSERILDQYPLSPIQHGMLLHALNEPNSGVDVEQIVCTLRENVDAPSLRKAWECVVKRNSVFRTAFRVEGIDDPLQIVYDRVSLPWNELDWRDVDPPEQKNQLQNFLERDRVQGFEVNAAPLLRLTLIRTEQEEYQLIWTFHHALLDGRSFPQVLKEAFGIYDAGCRGQIVQLEPPREYREHIDWLRSQDSSKASNYWREMLKGFSAPTPLVVEKVSRDRVDQSSRQADERTMLTEHQTSRLRTFAAEVGVTLNTLVQTAWALLLSRYSGEEDIVFGTVRACRKSGIEGADDVVGLFINTLPLRVRPRSMMPLQQLLMEVRSQWLSMREWEHTPLVQVQKCSEVSNSRLFDTILMFDNYELSQRLRAQGGDWANRSFRLYEQTGHAITLTAYADLALCLQIEYDRARFDHSAIHRMLGHLKTLLEGFLAGSEQLVRDLPLLTESERGNLAEWNNTAVDYPSNSLLHRLFEVQVLRSPDEVAVQSELGKLTYRELNERSNQLACYLRRFGVKQDCLVGVYMERSLDLVVALYAVLKAGGAYVPIDPDYPTERVAFMLQDAAAPVVLTHDVVASQLPVHVGRTVVVDRDWCAISREDKTNLVPETTPNGLAYMIYTSGSTGRPKGALNTHAGICNRLLWMQDQYQLTEADAILQKTPFSFDVSVWEFFWPLITGARLVLAAPGGHKDPAYLIRVIREQRVTVAHFVPSMLAMFLEEPNASQCTSLRQVICSGEALPFELQERFFKTLDAELDNLYGPTEAAVDVTYWHCERESDRRIVPIGRPVANTHVYVLDGDLRMQPVGVPGELYIGGVQVGRGYHNREELTQERFIPDPFSHIPEGRLYRTGDLCRWLADGSIEYLGRTDFQVKIRGLRIELGEIEALIAEYPPVRSCVVVARPDRAGQPQLAAYIVWNSDQEGSSDGLRDHLKSKLPDYMVPPFFVPLKVLPLSPNGKIDRKALPVPTLRSEEAVAPMAAAPRSEQEVKVAQIWRELLGVDKIGRNSNFFDLGGHSLLLIKARNKLEQVFGKQIPIVEMFRRPTLSSLAEFVAGDSEPELLIRSRTQLRSYRNAARLRLQRRQVKVN